VRDDLAYIRHILESIEIIESHILGVTMENFIGSFLIQDAVIRRFEIIGEATKNCSNSKRALFCSFKTVTL
jgi:uncharacterized protein with HEPN domain